MSLWPLNFDHALEVKILSIIPRSERLRDTKSTGDTLKETANINRSLFALGKVRVLRWFRSSHDPETQHVNVWATVSIL